MSLFKKKYNTLKEINKRWGRFGIKFSKLKRIKGIK